MPIGSDTITSTFSGISTSSTFPLTITTTSRSRGFPASSLAQCSDIALASTAYTRLAPAIAAKNDSIPDPAPTSMTTLSLKSRAFSSMAVKYVPVRTASWSMFCCLGINP